MVRRRRSWDILLELSYNIKDTVGFSSKLKQILGENAIVSSLEPMTTLEIRGTDYLTTVDDVQDAVKRSIGSSKSA